MSHIGAMQRASSHSNSRKSEVAAIEPTKEPVRALIADGVLTTSTRARAVPSVESRFAHEDRLTPSYLDVIQVLKL